MEGWAGRCFVFYVDDGSYFTSNRQLCDSMESFEAFYYNGDTLN